MSENIIKPRIEDSLEIATLIKDAWNSAYRGLISDEYLDNMDIQKISENWKEEIQKNKNNIYVYKENNHILGVIRFGKAEDLTTKNMGEIFVLYVRPDEKRKGIGTKLFDFAKTQLIKEGYNKMIIWCMKGNTQGSHFYKKHGGEKIKERDYEIRGIKIREEGFIFDLNKERR